jgi:DNA (cytosine-5)-methyltransferase 1
MPQRLVVDCLPARPRLLDLFCGAGGCSVGYARAGFDVVGVDVEPHPDYPFPLVVADALDVLADADLLRGFDVIHASPPCQALTTMSNRHRSTATRAVRHRNLIPAVQAAIDAWGGPYVIENVPGARRWLRVPVRYTGGYFGLGVERPRLFESNLPLVAPPMRKVTDPIGVYGHAPDGRRLWTRADGTTQRAARTLAQAQAAMGITWMSWADLVQAIPPAYTEHIGHQLRDHLAAAKDAAACWRPPATGDCPPWRPPTTARGRARARTTPGTRPWQSSPQRRTEISR